MMPGKIVSRNFKRTIRFSRSSSFTLRVLRRASEKAALLRSSPSVRGRGFNDIMTPSMNLMDGLHLALHVIHQQIFAESMRSSEVGFATAHLRHALHKLNQAEI